MTHSYTDQTEAARSGGLSAGYRIWFGFPVAAELNYPRGSISGGYLISSAEDMARYMIAHLNGGGWNPLGRGNCSDVQPGSRRVGCRGIRPCWPSGWRRT